MFNGPVQILWQTGKADHEDLRQAFDQTQGPVRVLPFVEEMEQAYAAADVVLCRAGATTLAELMCLGKPAILVPYPYAAAGHQELNARLLVEAGGARMLLDEELSGKRLAEEITDLLDHPDQRKIMTEKSRAMGRPNAAAEIVDILVKLAKKKA